MRRKKKRQLALNRATVRNLTGSGLEAAAGGAFGSGLAQNKYCSRIMSRCSDVASAHGVCAAEATTALC